jgi:hypothetical protein
MRPELQKKIDAAIRLLKAYDNPDEPMEIAYSGGKGFACDRFHWWNMEQRVGMTHYEYMLKQATESDKETMDIQ